MASNYTDPSDYCTLDLCPLTDAYIDYIPSLGGNAFYLALFSLLLLLQTILGIRYRTWGYLAGLTGGLILEVIGYAGRLQMHSNPFKFSSFLQYLICLTIAPAFLSASIYICLGRIVIVYGETISRLKPRTYTIIFITCDLLSLILQAAGGAITSIADADQADLAQTGINIMIAGLASQVASLTLFMGLCLDYAWRVWSTPEGVNSSVEMEVLRRTKRWRGFLFGLALATVTIFIRSVFRVAELKDGFDGELANDEVTFMVLEGAMIAITVVCLTVMHPGYCFGGCWGQTAWRFREQVGKEKGLVSRREESESDV